MISARKIWFLLVIILALCAIGMIEWPALIVLLIAVTVLLLIKNRDRLVYGALVTTILIPITYFWQADWARALANITFGLLAFYLLRRLWLDDKDK